MGRRGGGARATGAGMEAREQARHHRREWVTGARTVGAGMVTRE
jgi:hypothetical protein